MSFQAYLDAIEKKTGKIPEDLVAEAKAKNLTKHGEILDWLKEEYQLGTGHARALAQVIIKGPEIEVTRTTGPHRDESSLLRLDGIANRDKSP